MGRKRDKITKELRDRILKRDGHACRYCYSKIGPFHMDHVYPFSRGGETTYANLVTACSHCNSKKYNRVGIWPRPIRPLRKKHRQWERILPARVPELITSATVQTPVLVEKTAPKQKPFWEIVFVVLMAFMLVSSVCFILSAFADDGDGRVWFQSVAAVCFAFPIFVMAIEPIFRARSIRSILQTSK
jgi:hypothetical protein